MDPVLILVCCGGIVFVGGWILLLQLGARGRIRILERVAAQFGGSFRRGRLFQTPAAEWTMLGRPARLSFQEFYTRHDRNKVPHTVLDLDLFCEEVALIRFQLNALDGEVLVAYRHPGELSRSAVKLRLKVSNLGEDTVLLPAEPDESWVHDPLGALAELALGDAASAGRPSEAEIQALAERVLTEEVQEALAGMVRDTPEGRFILVVREGKLHVEVRGWVRKRPELLQLIARCEGVFAALLGDSERVRALRPGGWSSAAGA